MTINDLKEQGLILYECISGSRAYGLDTETSDTDIKGVFYLPKKQFYGLHYTAQIANETNDEVYYELGRYVELLVRNNPNILELLATPAESILYKHPVLEGLTEKMFLSKLCKETFAGYAVTQIRKARGYNRKVVNPVAEERKSVLDFCFIVQGYTSESLAVWLSANGCRQEACGLTSIPHSKGLYGLFYDRAEALGYKGISSGALANDISLSSVPAGEKEVAYLFFNREGYSSYCKRYREYWEWVARRNEVRYAGNREHGKDYDAKNMMHTIRLLQVAAEILQEGTLQVRRTNREELLSIKRGSYEYEALLNKADALMEQSEAAYERSSLPAEPDSTHAEQVLIAMREQLYT